MGLVFELLTALSGDGDELSPDIRECGEVAPEFFELGDRIDVFLGVAPAFLDFFQGDVSGHAGREIADGGVDVFGRGGGGRGRVIGMGRGGGEEIGARQAEDVEQLIEVDPCGHRVVVREFEFLLFARHGEAFDQAQAAINAGETAAAVIEAARDDLEREAVAAMDVEAEDGGVEVGAERIDVVKEEVTQLGTLLEEVGDHAITEEVGDFEPMSNRMKTLEGEIIGVVGGFAG